MRTSNKAFLYPLHAYRAPVFQTILAILEDNPHPNFKHENIIKHSGWQSLVAFLTQNGLANIFYTHLSESSDYFPDAQAVKAALRTSSLIDAGRYLSQKHTLKTIHVTLENANITYAIFKGAHVRESAYQQAWLRNTADIDVLITDVDRERAIKALRDAGMEYHPNPEVLSHEVTLSDADTSVDLHWHIMRPGRTRTDMTETLLEDAELSNGYRGMNPTATLFVLLTHPAINKYVCSPDAKLIKLVDLHLWMKHPDINHDELFLLINKAGLKAAAWSTLFLLRLLTQEQRYPKLFDKLQPGYLHRGYLMFWISRDLPTRFYKHRLLMRTAFSLSLHDNCRDMMRATAKLIGYALKRKE